MQYKQSLSTNQQMLNTLTTKTYLRGIENSSNVHMRFRSVKKGRKYRKMQEKSPLEVRMEEL